jgi:hypothetical protein
MALLVAAVAVPVLVPAALVSQGRPVPRNPTRQATSTSTWIPPRTPWGDPDLQGVYTNQEELNVPIERPDRFAGRMLNEITAAELTDFEHQSNEARRRTAEQNNGFLGLSPIRFDLKPSRPWLIVDPPDGKIPPLTAAGRQRQAAYTARLAQSFDAAENFSLADRCISLGVLRSMMPSVEAPSFRIVQAPGVVAITYEVIHEARLIALDGRPQRAGRIRTYMGDARGHWEGSTLVVETTGFSGVFPLTSPASMDLRLVERFRQLVPGSLEWSVTLDDPSAWTRPWTIAVPLTKTDEEAHALEYACHEGNYALRNMLSGARATEKDGQAESRR